MKRVLIRPPWDPWLGNRMFNDAAGCVYTRAFALWRTRARERSIAIDTWDTQPISQADCIWMIDLPPRRRIYEQARKQTRPGTPFVLQNLESPLVRPHGFVPANRRHFQAVVSYEPQLDEAQMQFTYRLPNTMRRAASPRPFHERRCAVMVNSNRFEGWLAVRQPGLAGLPGLGRSFSGWRLEAAMVVAPARGELYSWRRQLARTADSLGDNLLDVFGSGWRGEQISWVPGYRNRTYGCAVRANGFAAGSESRRAKHELLCNYRFAVATENFRGHRGYISEKIMDAIMAGAVPVYLGEERIADAVPAACFVDVRQFRDHAELLSYLADCPEQQWNAMREAGQAFLDSPAIQAFTDEAFAERMVDVLDHVFLSHGLKTD